MDGTFSRFSSHEAHDTKPERQPVSAWAPVSGRSNGNAILPGGGEWSKEPSGLSSGFYLSPRNLISLKKRSNFKIVLDLQKVAKIVPSAPVGPPHTQLP